ncbi:AraC family transcriptional regulator [Variovorax sp. YR216]|uniref:AraC family transcriptional regulator n=1 Tax=Variovorax sp. YR216 TaxID=1882828 RepID=UPI00089C0D89|nr:AraC family transcriptional regulator ligand-binding domain-containing protein [Variovorax sp. YR216]SEB22335.1 AraC-type DNA-binding protein [Variovorax sp. YR216]
MATLVRAACLTNYREIAIGSGLNPERMLLDAGLSPGVLDEPDLMIPVERVGRLLQASAHASSIECFGLCMARSRFLSNLGAVGLLIRDQPTLRDSLNVLMRYQAMLNGALTLAIEEHEKIVVIREVLIAGSTHQPTRQRVELALGVMVRIVQQLLGSDWRPRRVCFEHAPPKDLATHVQLFGHAIEFNREFNGIVCSRADLDTRNPSADPAMARYAQQLVDASFRQHLASMLDDVRRTALLLLPGGRCSIEKVSEQLGLVPRTVQRRLAEQSQSFSSVVNDLRKELAVRYVNESDRPLNEVADLLGLTPSSFSRWYQSQFNCSAKESRARQ